MTPALAPQPCAMSCRCRFVAAAARRVVVNGEECEQTPAGKGPAGRDRSGNPLSPDVIVEAQCEDEQEELISKLNSVSLQSRGTHTFPSGASSVRRTSRTEGGAVIQPYPDPPGTLQERGSSRAL
ncbi:hypothetical protein NFI96_002164 [Prochilodus magdalenae]|nr:hypothetical protein NFI96_002164 [Prochilodus magdalenae]